MASGQDIYPQDLPPEISAETGESGAPASAGGDWRAMLQDWVAASYEAGQTGLLNEVETVMIKAALLATGDRRQEAAQLLGWGRNTLTRKLKDIE